MPFWSDVLRISGVVAGAALSATGVASPLGGALIAAAVSVPASVGASLIEKKDAENKADNCSDQSKRNIQQQAQAEKDRLEKERLDKEKEAKQKRDQAAIPDSIIKACQADSLGQVRALLARLTDEQFEALGARPVAVCQSAGSRQTVQSYLDAEQDRRDALRPRPSMRR
jgi:hypothetical protein